MLAVHHALCDGTSLAALLHELLVALAGGALPPAEASAEAALDAVPPPAWQRWAAPLLRAAWPLEVHRSQLAPRPGRRTLWASRTSAGTLPALRAACARNGVTVGSALLAATALALDAPALDVAVDLRRHARPPVPADRLGLWTGGVRVNAAGARSWDAARAAQADLARQLAWDLHLLPQVVLDGVDGRRLLDRRGLDPDAPAGPPQVSNVGRWPYPREHDGLVLREVYGGNGTVGRGPALLLWLRGIGDRLCWNAVGAAPWIGREALEGALAAVARIVEGVPADDATAADLLAPARAAA